MSPTSEPPGDGAVGPAAVDMRGVLAAGGEVGRDLLAVDWDATPLGPPEAWPQSLQTVVRLLLASRFSMWMAWGPELTFLCNAAYQRDTLGGKYPWALGRPASAVWSEIWSDIGPRIETVVQTGVATWDEALRLFVERSGYVEETYHTFSYSPLADDSGRIAGMLCVVSEVTDQVIGERRMRTLRDLGTEPGAARSESQVIEHAVRQLEGNPESLPFTLIYLLDEDSGQARLAGTSGVRAGHPVAPNFISVDDSSVTWPLHAAAGGSVLVPALGQRFSALPTGGWAEPPVQALVTPLAQQGHDRPYGFLIVGLNRYRPFDEGYQGFVELLAGQLAARVASARAYEDERQRAEQLAELDRAKTAFFTNVSHEFRTPLTLLLGPVEDALADPAHPLPVPQRRRVEVARRNARRLLQLVNTLLDFSRLEGGNVVPRLEPVDLSRYTAELASMFDSAVERAGLSLRVSAPPLGEPVYLDRDMWERVVLNLLANAVKYTFTGGITVQVAAAEGFAELRVSDTGIGIGPEDQLHLFERFHRVPGAHGRSHEGSGIGLALVAELVRLHGGTVGVDSTAGVGSTFTVRVPLGPPPGHVQGPSGEEPATAPGQQLGGLDQTLHWLDRDLPAEFAAVDDGKDRLRVLVVDDNADMRGYVAALLGGHYRVEVAVDGVDGLARARASRPDLVLTDVMMPNLDGFGLLAALRADPVTTGIPVVMLSARAGEEGTVEGLEAGADDYLTKPFSARELLARVRANLELDRSRRTRTELERSQELLAQAQQLARVGSWQIDLASGEVIGSPEYFRLLGVAPEELRAGGVPAALRYVHPDDVDLVVATIEAAQLGGTVDVEFRVRPSGGGERLVRAHGLLGSDVDGRPVYLRGSLQDITEQHQAAQALRAAAVAEEAAGREHRIADELQRSLLPQPAFDPDHLEVATYYRAGVEGTQVGGDWFDVIELGAGRTALVIGDVMGRGVRAAAVMGQLRSAVRAYARLDLPPADLLESLDGVVRDLGEDQIVTCVYAVFDPADATLAYANAGHLPPLLTGGDGVRRLSGAGGPPLGTGPLTIREERVPLPVGAMLALYTDGLVENRHSDIDTGIDALAARLAGPPGALEGVPTDLVNALLPDGPTDDVAVLLARVSAEHRESRSARLEVPADPRMAEGARRFAAEALAGWDVPQEVSRDVVLLVSELVTNAVLHAEAPIELRLRVAPRRIVVEVYDSAVMLPRRLRPSLMDEHGRGLHLVALLADRWGTRPTATGKAVWFTLPLRPSAPR